jgi:fatty-acyl-CoA synthase
MDMLPVTAIGKLYKLALRADATRRAIIEALAGFNAEVDTVTENGTPITTVSIGPDVDEAAVKSELDHYSITWKLTSQC